MNTIHAGCIVSRREALFMVVNCGTFNSYLGSDTGIQDFNKYGIVNLSTGEFQKLDVSLETLSDILKKAKLEFLAPSLFTYFNSGVV